MLTALVSLDQVWEDRQANLERCRQLALQAAGMGARLTVFPEMTLTGFTMNARRVAEPASGSPTVEAFAELAREACSFIAFGVVLQGRHRPKNTLVVVDPAGREIARYAKLHPFSFAGEHEHYEAGDELVSVTVEGLRVGATICYDLRFPELYTALTGSCDLILVIANWPAARIAHWHTLLRARAIDGQCFIAGVNRTGTDDHDISYPASSELIDPRGERVEAAHTDGCIAVYDVRADVVSRCREAFPTLRDRRPQLYGR